MPNDPSEPNLDRLAETPEPGLVTEMFDFLVQNRNWWLMPIVLALVVFGALLALAGTGAAPFIYTLF